MDTIDEAPRATPVIEDCDLCVIGGSCTGVFAAVRAARAGMRVALIELHGCFGGVATSRLVNVWHSLWNTEGTHRIIAGLTEEITQRLGRRGAVIERGPGERGHESWQFCFNSAELAIELDELVREHPRIRPFLHCRFVAAVGGDGRCDAIVIEDKSGRRAIRARTFLDASGDGDLVRRFGLTTHQTEQLQPPTMAAIIEGLNESGIDLAGTVYAADNPHRLEKGFLWAAPVPGSKATRSVFGTRIHGVDCSDADQLTAAEMEGRRQVRCIVDGLRHRYGADAAALVALPACIGIRETHHASCLHQLTEDEVLEGVRFDDAIANGSYRVDVHHQGSGGLTFRYLDGRELVVDPQQPTINRRWRDERERDPTFYQIPYRSMVPRGSVNLLVAGRNHDADIGAFGATRVVVNCSQMGEAAGLALEQVANSGCAVDAVDVPKLRETLVAGGSVML